MVAKQRNGGEHRSFLQYKYVATTPQIETVGRKNLIHKRTDASMWDFVTQEALEGKKIPLLE
jgi:hypothetical protein